MALKRSVRIFGSGGKMAAAAVRIFIREYRLALRKKGRFTAALSGGRTPAAFFKALARTRGLDWSRIFLIQADERLVPPSSPERNYRSLKTLLLKKVRVPAENILSVPDLKGASAARNYAQKAKYFLGLGGLDAVFLGLGADGHTASLFPGSPALQSRAFAAYAKAPAYAQPAERVTLTLKALNSAETAVFLVSGTEKAGAFERLAAGRGRSPAAGVKPLKEAFYFYTRHS